MLLFFFLLKFSGEEQGILTNFYQILDTGAINAVHEVNEIVCFMYF